MCVCVCASERERERVQPVVVSAYKKLLHTDKTRYLPVVNPQLLLFIAFCQTNTKHTHTHRHTYRGRYTFAPLALSLCFIANSEQKIYAKSNLQNGNTKCLLFYACERKPRDLSRMAGQLLS